MREAGAAGLPDLERAIRKMNQYHTGLGSSFKREPSCSQGIWQAPFVRVYLSLDGFIFSENWESRNTKQARYTPRQPHRE
jgi:hypothetical protein